MSGAHIKFSNVGAGLGGGFEDTNELKPMKHNEAINGPDGGHGNVRSKISITAW